MLLKPGQMVTCLISKHHSILTSNQMKAIQIRDMFKDTMT